MLRCRPGTLTNTIACKSWDTHPCYLRTGAQCIITLRSLSFLNHRESSPDHMARRVVDVVVPVAVDQAYSYQAPDSMALAPGDIVTVPLGTRAATAVVWAENPNPNPRLDNRLKAITD